jgi:hypothetical protein
MIRCFVFGALCFIICSSHAQERIALQAGYNSAKWNYTIPPANWITTTDEISGFNAGVLVQHELKNRFGIQGALVFNRTGTKLRHVYRFQSSSREIKLYSLNLPVVVMYNLDIKKMRFGLGGGFYGAYRFAGTEKGTAETFVINGSPQIQYVDNKIEFGGPSDQRFDPSSTTPINLNRFDAGYVVMINIEFNRLLIFQASYNGGLRNVLSSEYYFGGNFKNNVISLSMAVLLSRRSGKKDKKT